MAETQDISTALKRKLKGGKEYDKLIPRVSCRKTSLGEGDTYFTVDQMRGWVEKYRHQTAKLALELEGQTLQETVKNIYDFLYNHVQYTADGALQQLRSPACTWAQRKQGVDCKSFSVFASSVLSNLGIKHAIRQVRQAYFYPEEFTHVYVVVFKDQSKETFSKDAPTFVLDATKHENIEVEYIEKADLQMNKLQHVGLNAPQDERTKNIIENFNKFSNFLIVKGISATTVNAMREEVSKYTSQGIDPQFKIVDKGLVIQGKLFVLNFPNPNGLGFVDPASMTAYASAGKAILNMLPGDFVADTFGAVFANGLDFSCWGSSTNPQKSQGIVTNSIKPFFEKCMEKITNPSSHSELVKYFNLALEASYKLEALYGDMAKNTDWADCTIKGHEVIAEFGAGIRTHFDSLLNSGQFTVQKRTVNGKAPFTFPASMTADRKDYKIGTGGAANFPVSYPQITYIEAKSSGSTGGSTGGGNNTGGGSNYQPGTGTVGNGDATAQKSGSNTGIIIGGVALAALPFLLPMMKKSPVATAKPKPTTKPKPKSKKTAK